MFVSVESSGMTGSRSNNTSITKSPIIRNGRLLLEELQKVPIEGNESSHLKRRLYIRTNWTSGELVQAYNTLIQHIKGDTVKEVDRMYLRAMEQERIMEGGRFTGDIEDGKENFSVLHEQSTNQYNPNLGRIDEFRGIANLRVWAVIKKN